MKAAPYPTEKGWLKYWTDLCSMVSTKSAHPAYALQWMFDIERLRALKTFGTIRSWIHLVPSYDYVSWRYSEVKISSGSELNGRQVAWMLRYRFKLDVEEGRFYTGRQLIGMQLENDSVPGYLIVSTVGAV